MGSYCLMGSGFLFGRMKKLWECIAVMVAQQCEFMLCHWIVHFKMFIIANFMLYMFYHNKKDNNRDYL